MRLTWTSMWTRTSWSFWRRCPDDRGQWTQGVSDWDKKYCGAKSGTLLDSQKVYEGRLRELANIEKQEVAEPIQLQEARAQSLEIVYGKSGWMMQKGRRWTQMRSVADWLQHSYTRTPARSDAGDTTSQSVQNHRESSCNENECEGTARLFDRQTRHQSGVLQCEGERES